MGSLQGWKLGCSKAVWRENKSGEKINQETWAPFSCANN